MDFNKKTVAELRELLEAFELSSAGKKAELVERLKEYKAMPRESPVGFQRIPKDVLPKISDYATHSPEFFISKFEVAKTISNPKLLVLAFSPDTIILNAANKSKTYTRGEKEFGSWVSMDGLIETMNGILETPNIQSCVFKNAHLQARVSLGHGRMDFQILVFSPTNVGIGANANATTPALYELVGHGIEPFQPASMTPNYIFHFLQFAVKNKKDTEFEYLWKGLADAMLGLSWIQTFFLHKRGRVSPLITEDSIRVVFNDPLKPSMNIINQLKASLLKRAKKIFRA
jgi:hypothetical protein